MRRGAAIGVDVIVGCRVAVEVAWAAVAVQLGVALGVIVGVIVIVGVRVAVHVAVAIGVGVDVSVAVGVGVGGSVAGGIGVGVLVHVGVRVARSVAVGVGCTVALGDSLALCVGSDLRVGSITASSAVSDKVGVPSSFSTSGSSSVTMTHKKRNRKNAPPIISQRGLLFFLLGWSSSNTLSSPVRRFRQTSATPLRFHMEGDKGQLSMIDGHFSRCRASSYCLTLSSGRSPLICTRMLSFAKTQLKNMALARPSST